MNIAFVLPCLSAAPVGGFKVVYRYSNLLVERGHRVSVFHPLLWNPAKGPKRRLGARYRVARLRRDRAAIVPWMEIDPRVDLVVCEDSTKVSPPPVEALFATAWQTAELVAAAAGGEGFYLVQGYETWSSDDAEAVRSTWRLPLRKIVVSRWLEEVAEELGVGAETTYVPIGLDQELWGVDRPSEGRPPRVGAAFAPYKDPADAVAALEAARDSVPALEAVGFGTEERPAELPPWVEYERRPDAVALRHLYNSCSVFMQASRNEGWGLPAAESMACGCALVTYDSGGSREYACDGETALVAEPGPEHLAAAIARLDGDRELRLALARRGREKVREFTWERAVEGLEGVLAGSVSRAARR